MNSLLWFRAVPLAFLAVLALGFGKWPPHFAAQKSERARVVATQPWPAVHGDQLKVVLVAVHYGPGEASAPHRHACGVLGYVTKGAVCMKIADQPETVYNAGESFFEAPNQLHGVSANASASEPADFLAYFVCDTDGPLSSDATEEKRQQP